MQQNFAPKSPDSLPEHTKQYIDLRIKWFINTFLLKNQDWPLDCVRLLKKLKASQRIPLSYGLVRLPNKYDAITEYVPDHNIYIMQINRNKANYPFEYSRDRRLNFTIAHEIGHIVLEHLVIPRNLKTTFELYLEELEANEFAGRLLMPEKILYSCNFYSMEKTAEYFIVSKTALWKRLNNINQVRLLNSRKIRSCSLCGNTKFSSFAEHCCICDESIRNGLTGIRRFYFHEEYKMDQFKRVIFCSLCKIPIGSGTKDKCLVCKTYIFNYCSSYFSDHPDECSYANPGNARFCEICGRHTYFYQKGLLVPWREADDFFG